jgi:hypothetical protein
MTPNPYMYALIALIYIGAVSSFMRFIESIRHNTPDTLFDGVGFLSLFVCSAAVMAFLFFYQPVVLLIEGKKHEALVFFLKTLGTFGFTTVCSLTLVSAQ